MVAGEGFMSKSPRIELTSKDRLLTSMRLAIDETKLIRSINKNKDTARSLKTENPFSQRLKHLNQEITKLEAELIQVRTMAQSLER
jgi:hypothetical protein